MALISPRYFYLGTRVCDLQDTLKENAVELLLIVSPLHLPPEIFDFMSQKIRDSENGFLI